MSEILLMLAGFLLAVQSLGVVLSRMPREFWQAIDGWNPVKTAMLWGFSHPFGPRYRTGELKPFYRD